MTPLKKREVDLILFTGFGFVDDRLIGNLRKIEMKKFKKFVLIFIAQQILLKKYAGIEPVN